MKKLIKFTLILYIILQLILITFYAFTGNILFARIGIVLSVIESAIVLLAIISKM